MVNEPEPKRKTLAERAGEPARSGILAPSASRPTIKGTSLVGARNTFASSTSSHGRSNSVRNASNNSFGSSVGYGSRPQTSFGARSANQTSFSQSTTARPQTSMASKRPASSMDDPDSDGGVGSDGKRKGTIPSSFFSLHSLDATGFQSLRNPKIRGARSLACLPKLDEVTKLRDLSISTALSRLDLNDAGCNVTPYESQAGSHDFKGTSKSGSETCALFPSGHITVRKPPRTPRPAMMDVFEDEQEVCAQRTSPKTPSHIPIAVPAKVEFPRVFPTPASARYPKFSPLKTSFLSKESNLPAFVAWDVRGRLEDVEAMYSALKDTMSGTTLERNGLEESVAKFKTRGILFSSSNSSAVEI